MNESRNLDEIKARKSIDNYLELVRFATRERFALLPTISTLAATFLVVATFNEQLIILTFFVKVLLAILLLLAILCVDIYYCELTTAERHGMLNAGKIAERQFNVNISEVEEEAKKKAPIFNSIRGYLPHTAVIVLNIVVLFLILLVLGVLFESPTTPPRFCIPTPSPSEPGF